MEDEKPKCPMCHGQGVIPIVSATATTFVVCACDAGIRMSLNLAYEEAMKTRAAVTEEHNKP